MSITFEVCWMIEFVVVLLLMFSEMYYVYISLTCITPWEYVCVSDVLWMT